MALAHSILDSNRIDASAELGVLAGITVLVVEDDTMAGFMIETMLLTYGCTEVLRANQVDIALGRLRTRRPDAAVLDVNIGLELVFPVAERLSAMNTPMLFATGCPATRIPPQWQGWPLLRKPYAMHSLLTLLARIVAS